MTKHPKTRSEEMRRAIVKRYADPGDPRYMGGAFGSFAASLKMDLGTLADTAEREGFVQGFQAAARRLILLAESLQDAAVTLWPPPVAKPEPPPQEAPPTPTPWVVIDCEAPEGPQVLLSFATHDEASEWIGKQPDREKIERGGYGIDGPPEE